MGDGRYYTLDQFFSILLLTILISLLAVRVMTVVYKVKARKRWVCLLGMLLMLGAFSIFIEKVAFSSLLQKTSRGFSTLFLLCYVGACVGESLKTQRMAPCFKAKFFENVYLFATTLIFWHLNRVIGVTALAGHFFWLSSKSVTYSVSAHVFAKVKKSIVDYVFIIDSKGAVVYKNSEAEAAPYFKPLKTIDCNSIEHIFVGKAIKKTLCEKEVISLETDSPAYFQYSQKPIFHKAQKVGYILTFVPVTELIELLHELEEKRAELRGINEQLTAYKEQVYVAEREREIHTLLKEIAETQHKAMLQLKQRIEALSMDDPEVRVKINRFKQLAKRDLRAVREAVTAYRNYYGRG